MDTKIVANPSIETSDFSYQAFAFVCVYNNPGICANDNNNA